MIKDLSKTMGVEMLPKIKKDLPEADDDFTAARENLIDTIEYCKKAMEQLAMISDQTGNARYFEVLNQTMKTMVDASKSLLELQRQIKQINNEPGEGPKKIVQNNMYLTTSDVLKLVKQAEKTTIDAKPIKNDSSDE